MARRSAYWLIILLSSQLLSFVRLAPSPRRPRVTRSVSGDDVVKFGKFKGKCTLEQLTREQPNYVQWVQRHHPHERWAQPLLQYCAGVKKPVPKAPSLARPAPPAAPPQGANGDFFALPESLEDFPQVYSCAGGVAANDDSGEPFVYNDRSGWRYVGRVVPGRTLAVNLRKQRAVGKDGCHELDLSDLTRIQYARYLAAVLEEESRQLPAETRTHSHPGGRIEIGKKFKFRGVVLADGKPYVAPTLKQEVYAPEEWNLARQPRTAMASLVGLKVHPVGPVQSWFQGLIVCNETLKAKPLDDGERQRLLSMTKTPKIRAATEQARLGELIVLVSRNCTSENELKMSFVASALRPSLSGQEEKVRKVRGLEDWRDVPPANYVLKPRERQQAIEAQVQSLAEALFKRPLVRLEGQEHFRQLNPPELIVGQQRGVSGREKGSRILGALKRFGAYRLRPGSSVRLGAVLFGQPKPEEQQAAREILSAMIQDMADFGVEVLPGEVQTLQRLRDDALSAADAYLFFRTRSLSPRAFDRLYDRSKYECLASHGQHLASQWFDLTKSVWRPGKRSFGVAVNAVALLGKLGHVPWALSIRNWFTSPSAVDVAVLGYDVCHLPDPRRPSQLQHVAAGIRLSSEQPLVLSNVSFRTERVASETVPPESLRKLLPKDFARGKLIIVHRDGEFPLPELEALKKYHAELASEDPKTAFVLVELVKWSNGSPRLYDGSASAKEGTMFIFNSKEVLLSSSKELLQGTANPINVRLCKVLGNVPRSFALSDFAWVSSAFDLSYLHHGSVVRRPKLPITTHFADRLAYVLASAGEDGTDWDRELADVSERNTGVQFWL